MTKKKYKAPKCDDGYVHEAMHAAHMICDMWYDHVKDTVCSDAFPDVEKAADKALTEMYKVYQLIGQKFKD